MADYGQSKPEDMPADVIGRTLVYQVFEHAERTPDALALVAARSAGEEVSRTYRALRDDVVRLADGLQTFRIGRGDSIGVLCDNENAYQATVVILATSLIGAVFVPLNARYSARELEDAAGRAKCIAIFAAAKLEPVLAAARPNLPALRLILGMTQEDDHAPCFDDVLARGDVHAAGWPTLHPDDVSEIMFTSGTTALPKAVVQTHGRTAASAHIFKLTLELTPEDKHHSPFPIFTSACTKCVIFPALSAGATVVIDPNTSVSSVLERMVRVGSTVYYAVPSFYLYLIDHLEKANAKGPSLRLLIYGGATMPPTTMEKIAELFPETGLAHTFGSSETGATGTILYPKYSKAKIGSIGKAEPFTEVTLLGDNGAPVPAGDRGEIAVRSPAVFKEYLGDPETSAATLRDGWVLTGDIGVRDEDGFLFHVDRKKDIIIRGGHNIGSMEVERIVYEYPGVAEAAAVGVPHPKLGEDILVFVVAAEGASLDKESLIEHCKLSMSDYKVPRHIVFIDQMPRNPMGKILKTQLRVRAREYMAGL